MACFRHLWVWDRPCPRCPQEQARESMIRQIICTIHRRTYLEGSRCEACAAELEGTQPPGRELNPDHPAWANVRFLTALAGLEAPPARRLDEMTHHSGGLVPEGASRTVTGRAMEVVNRAEEFECSAHGPYYSLIGPTCPVCERTGRNALSFDRNNLHSCVLHGNYYSNSGRCPTCAENRRASIERAALAGRRLPPTREFFCNEHGSYLSVAGPGCPACSAPADGLGLDPGHVGSCSVHGNYYNANGRCPVCEENTRASVDLHRAWQRSLPNEIDARYQQHLSDCFRQDVATLGQLDDDERSYTEVHRFSHAQPRDMINENEEQLHLTVHMSVYWALFGLGEDFVIVGMYGGPDDDAHFVGFVANDPWRNIAIQIRKDDLAGYRACTLHMNLQGRGETPSVEQQLDQPTKPGRRIRARPRKGESK